MILDAAKSSALAKVPDDNDSLPTFGEAIAGPSTTSINLSSLSGTNKPHQDTITTSDSDAPFSSPPEFSTWDAEYGVASSGDIVSHDAHLNEDGEALYRFLLTQLQYVILCGYSSSSTPMMCGSKPAHISFAFQWCS
jgi:hypothetical protein